jgi:hypothetical protein
MAVRQPQQCSQAPQQLCRAPPQGLRRVARVFAARHHHSCACHMQWAQQLAPQQDADTQARWPTPGSCLRSSCSMLVLCIASRQQALAYAFTAARHSVTVALGGAAASAWSPRVHGCGGYHVGTCVAGIIIIMLQPVLQWFPTHRSGCATCGQSPKFNASVTRPIWFHMAGSSRQSRCILLCVCE